MIETAIAPSIIKQDFIDDHYWALEDNSQDKIQVTTGFDAFVKTANLLPQWFPETEVAGTSSKVLQQQRSKCCL